jgi:hypothetical protein
MSTERSLKPLALAWVLALLLVAVALPVAAVAAPVSAAETREELQNTRIHDLRKDVDEHEKIITYLLFPVTVLVGILSLGGAIGIVFSIRDQRRVSQLHELSVAGEMSSQRRTEQSYGSFFEQSQTTLSLVNETLQLAKDATAQAAKSMDEKAQVRVDAIEDKAEKLMLDLFNTREFDVVVSDPTRRRELQEIAKELRTLEGYLSLQKIKLGNYTKFVKAIDQFLEGETEAALAALQLASQDPVVGDLQKFIEYWAGYLLTTVGQYGEAVERFEHDELDLSENSSQYFQLERIIVATKFFLVAKPKPKSKREEDGAGEPEVVDPRTPKARYQAVAPLLDRLTTLTQRLRAHETRDDHTHTLLEVARTQADIYEWVAYDPKHLDEPIDKEVVDEAREIIENPEHPPMAELAEAPADPPIGKAVAFIDSPLWSALDDGDLFRSWALLQAQAICEEWDTSSADVAFALAECHFKLDNPRAAAEFRKADDELHAEMAEHREQRREASILQSLLICHCRLLKLQEVAEQDQKDGGEELREANQEVQQRETGAIRATQREVLDAVKEMGRGRVTIFSQIQRRNLTQDEFKAEVGRIVSDMHLGEGEDEPPSDEEGVGVAEAT